MSITRRLTIAGAVGALFLLSACGGSTFRTFYAKPVPAEVSKSWRVVGVDVTVPKTLTVSEEKTSLPKADIVWREDPETGDRYAQVATIMTNAVKQGVAGLRGSRPVRLSITMTRFHALTFEAETKYQNAGVHNVDFVAQVTDAATGAVLAGPETIEAAFPALSGDQMIAARAAGQTQKSMITAHVRQTIAGWIGAGPDNRSSFARSGG
jgi:hypothetical protein